MSKESKALLREVYQENPRGRFIPCRHCPNVECTCFTELEQGLLDKLTDTQKAYEQDKARIEKLEAENAIATATINKMQTLIKPWMNPNSTFGKDLNAAFNCGAEFNSKNPQLFTEYLDLRKLRSQGHE